MKPTFDWFFCTIYIDDWIIQWMVNFVNVHERFMQFILFFILHQRTNRRPKAYISIRFKQTLLAYTYIQHESMAIT